MANFWDDLNNKALVAAQGGANQDWEQFYKLERMKELAAQRQQQAQPQDKGNFLTHLIPTGGGIAGSLGGAAAGAAAGSVLPGIGTAVGGLLGAILGGAGGSALGKVGENAAEGEKDLSKGVGGEALMGGLTSIPLGGAFKLARAGAKVATGIGKTGAGQLVKEAGAGAIPKMAGGLQARAAEEAGLGGQAAAGALKTGTQGRLTDLGNRSLASQYGTISKPVARATNPTQTVGALADMGITKPVDAERIASQITGTGGLLNKAVVNAVGKSGGVDTSTLRRVFNDALDNYGLVDTDRKSLQKVFDAQMNKMTGGARGSLSTTVNPSDALDTMKALEKRMADLRGKGSNYRLTTPERSDKANVLGLVKDELQGKLYDGAQGANAQIGQVMTPELRGQLLDLMPGNAKWQQFVDSQVMGARDVAGLRSAQKPFVNIGKIIDEGDINSMTFGGRAGDAFRQGGVRNMVADAGAALVKNPAARLAGGALRAAGGTGGRTAGAGAGQSLLGAGIRQGGGRGLADALTATPQQPASPVDENGLAPEDYQTLAAEGIGPGTDATAASMQPGQEANPFGVSKEQVASAMVQALNSGDVKGFDNLKELYTLMADSEASGTKASATMQKALSQSANADTTLNQLEGLLQQAGGAGGPVGGNVSGFFGGLGLNNNAKTYNDLVNGSVTQIAKALGETGAMSDADRAAYTNLLPKLTDTPEVAAQKFAALRQRMAAAQQNTLQYGSGSGLEEALASAGYM